MFIADSGLILPGNNDDRIFIFSKDNKPVYVREVPGVRFAGFPVCLSTDNSKKVEDVKKLTYEFYKLWAKIQASL